MARAEGGFLRTAAALGFGAAATACAAVGSAPDAVGLLELKGIILAVPNPQSASAWYAELFGEAARDQSFGSPGFAAGGDELSLELQPGPAVIAVWRVASIDAAFTRVVQLGAVPVTGIQEVGTVRMAIVRDPFGNLLGLAEDSARSR